MMMNETQTYNFHGQDLLLMDDNGEAVIAMRPVVEGMGMDWKSQSRKLNKQSKKFRCGHMTTPSAGGPQKMLCMPLKKLNLWLASINPNKIKDEAVREKVELYQEECADALYKYWFEGVAIRPDATFTEEQAIALAKQILIQTEQIDFLKAREAIFGNRTPYGTLSKYNGRPRINPVPGYLRSKRSGRPNFAVNANQLRLFEPLEF